MLEALLLTAELAFFTTVLLLFLGGAMAWWLARTQHALRPVVEAVTALPLVLPPTVLGFYLLLLFNPTGGFGGWLYALTGTTLTFSFAGLVVASLVYSLPFMVQPLQAAFEQVGPKPYDAARVLGASPLDAFATVVVPLAGRGVLTGLVLTFAHTVGEFGVVLMIGGNIPGETKVVSIAIYEHVEALRYNEAHILSAVLLAFSFTVLLFVYALNRKFPIQVVR